MTKKINEIIIVELGIIIHGIKIGVYKMKDRILKKIEGKFESLDESIQYLLGSLAEISSSIKTIHYLLYLIEDIKDVEEETK